ncbi:uncharacterized protein LOC131945872 isoform X2 [Physella acuta]|uniref:uncharacterized protein LOC131945872 isoform X2 n=1 Tax=Physella acuta TaxID=109671 RepID=UPI0027DB1010|nr:uncharacterized protein LOC131945872 isoform X2 [Physella acuta]
MALENERGEDHWEHGGERWKKKCKLLARLGMNTSGSPRTEWNGRDLLLPYSPQGVMRIKESRHRSSVGRGSILHKRKKKQMSKQVLAGAETA